MKRQYLISDATVRSILRELWHIEKNTISTPDTEANFKQIRGMLNNLKGV
jgi:hypothetical protein